MKSVILASKSATRIKLLTNAGVPFEAYGSGVDEEAAKVVLLRDAISPMGIAQALAEMKALAVSSRRPGIVVGADQTLDFEGRLFDKVESIAAARERLLMMRGVEHDLHTAVVVAEDGVVTWRVVESSRMTMRYFTNRFLDQYLERNGQQILSSVGCYQLEGEGLQLFDSIEGDYFSILGLPMLQLMTFLRTASVMAE
jgi:septum formation protein